MDAKKELEAAERLKQQRERERIDTEARRQALAGLVRQPEFQKQILGPEGWLAAHEQQALKDLGDERVTPLNEAVTLAVHLDRWRHLRHLRDELTKLVDAPAPSP